MNIVELAFKTNKSKEELFEIFDKLRITIVNENIDVTEEQINKFNEYLQKGSKGNANKAKKNEGKNKKKKSNPQENELEYYVKNDYKIFMDTCSLLRDTSEIFLNEFIALLKKHNSKLYLPTKIKDELDKHGSQKENIELAQKAKKILRILVEMNKEGLIIVKGEEGDGLADNVFLYVFTRHRVTSKLLLITQDNGLAQDTLGLNNYKSVRSKNNIAVKRINRHGKLDDDYGYKKNEKTSKDKSK